MFKSGSFNLGVLGICHFGPDSVFSCSLPPPHPQGLLAGCIILAQPLIGSCWGSGAQIQVTLCCWSWVAIPSSQSSSSTAGIGQYCPQSQANGTLSQGLGLGDPILAHSLLCLARNLQVQQDTPTQSLNSIPDSRLHSKYTGPQNSLPK